MMGPNDPVPDDFSAIDLIKNRALLVELVRGIRQIQRTEFVTTFGDVRRFQATPKALNATVDLGEIQTGVSSLPSSTVTSNPWSDLAIANGGCVTQVAIQIAEATHRAITAASFSLKIKMFWPFLGCNIITPLVPLIDRLSKGLAINTGFVDADFTQNAGIQGNGLSKYLNSLVLPNELGPFNAGGLGWWETNIAAAGATNVEPMGSYKLTNIPDNRFSFDLRPTSRGFRWGTTPAGVAGQGGIAAVDGHYYGQSQHASSRSFYIDGANLNVTPGTAGTTSDLPMLLMGVDGGASGIRPWAGRGFLAYMTDGTLTDAEVGAFHAILLKYLVNPKITGIPVPFIGAPGGGVIPNPDDPDFEEPISEDCVTCINSISTDRNTGEISVDRNTGNVSMALT